MAFAEDRDLLALEPNVFREVSWTAQRVLEATGSVSGTTLTLGAGVDAVNAGVKPGMVVLIGGVAAEVIAVVSATVLTVSRVRERREDAALGVGTRADQSVVITTFGPQIEVVHRQVLRMAGLEPAGNSEGVLTESAVTNADGLRLVETFGALHLVYAAAGAVSAGDSPLVRRAAMYRERYSQERERVEVRVDLNGDGRADAARRLNAARFVRV